MATRVENFKAKQSLVLSNSFGVINKEKDVELDVTVGIIDDESGYFELYDILSGGDNWYAEGSIQFDGKNVVLSNFKYSERKGEEELFSNWFEFGDYNVHRVSKSFEGQGDMLRDADGYIWLGTGFKGGAAHFINEHYEDYATATDRKEGMIRVSGVVWLTNLDIMKRHEDLVLYKTYNPEEYPKYDNYDAIEVSKTNEIPKDYDGVMGVPITFLDKYNPLRKIPTLTVNQLSITDSDNICFYLDSISNKKTLFPKNEYFKIISMVSVANGLMESVLERRMEIIRPTNEQSNSFINKQEIRIARTIKWLEENWKNYNDNYLTMDQIAIACSLEYTNFRLDNQWEKDSPKLIKWLKNFRQKDFMKSTVPLEAK